MSWEWSESLCYISCLLLIFLSFVLMATGSITVLIVMGLITVIAIVSLLYSHKQTDTLKQQKGITFSHKERKQEESRLGVGQDHLTVLRNRVRYLLVGGNRIVNLSEIEKDEIVQHAGMKLDKSGPKPHYSQMTFSQRVQETILWLIKNGELDGTLDEDRYIPNNESKE